MNITYFLSFVYDAAIIVVVVVFQELSAQKISMILPSGNQLHKFPSHEKELPKILSIL